MRQRLATARNTKINTVWANASIAGLQHSPHSPGGAGTERARRRQPPNFVRALVFGSDSQALCCLLRRSAGAQPLDAPLSSRVRTLLASRARRWPRNCSRAPAWVTYSGGERKSRAMLCWLSAPRRGRRRQRCRQARRRRCFPGVRSARTVPFRQRCAPAAKRRHLWLFQPTCRRGGGQGKNGSRRTGSRRRAG